MDFNLNAEHREFADSVGRFARDKLAAGALARAHSPQYPWDTSKLLAEQGLLGIAFPDQDGGQGGTLMHAVAANQSPQQLPADFSNPAAILLSHQTA